LIDWGLVKALRLF